MAASESRREAGSLDRLVSITRRINAPRELVFRMWTHPDFLMQWYAPRRCTLVIHSFDFRVGGTFRHEIRDPDGRGCLCSGVFEQIVTPARIVYSLFFSDAQGNLVEPGSIGADAGWPRRTTVTVTFAEDAGVTTMTLHQTVPEHIAKRTGAYPSWIEMLDRLGEALEDAQRRKVS